MYTAHVLNESQRVELLLSFPLPYPKVIAHHITVEFGVPSDTPAPAPAHIRILGSIDSGDGLQVMVCEVDGTTKRPDGGTYHITWSLDPDKYKPVDSNELILHNRYKMIIPVVLETTPEVLA